MGRSESYSLRRLDRIDPNLFAREASWGDFVANGIGAIVGAVIARQLGLLLCWPGDFNNVNN